MTAEPGDRRVPRRWLAAGTVVAGVAVLAAGPVTAAAATTSDPSASTSASTSTPSPTDAPVPTLSATEVPVPTPSPTEVPVPTPAPAPVPGVPVPSPGPTAPGTAPVRPPHFGTPPPKRAHPHRKPWPVTVTVQTVPTLPGLRLSWDGQVATTDGRGQVHFTAEHNFNRHALRLLDTGRSGDQVRYRFVRWAGQRDPMQAYRTEVDGLPQREAYTVTAAFSVQYPVSASIVDQNGVPVPPSRISGITLRDSTGEDVAFPVGGQVWLDGQVPVYRNSALEMRTEVYSLQRVMVQGTNTVNVGEQSLRPADRTPVVFRARFYDLTVVAHDALFRKSADGTARVRFPDGSVRLVALGPGRSVTLRELPRGVYTVDLVGNGTAVPSLVTLSRSATVDVTVATTWDLVTLALIGFGLALGLVVFGRGRHRTLRTVLATGRWTGSLATGAVRPVTRPLLRALRGRGPGTAAGAAVPGVPPGIGEGPAGPEP
ncbi:MAG TPA: hypothetical protein VFP72_07510, partial [Kineosporiaceae bacterium]|nr:hypothetical protein [Kineosporiaceae bacterium]